MENSTNDILEYSFSGSTMNKESTYEKNIVMFWVGVAIYLILAMVAATGNGLVLYVTFGNFNVGPLRHLDDVIKSLATADMLYGLCGIPLKIATDYYYGM